MDLENSVTGKQYLEYCNTALVQPLELVRLDTGLFVDFPVYCNEMTKKTLLKCDLCGAFTVLGKKKSTGRIYSHRSSNVCVQKQNHNQILELKGVKSRVDVSLLQVGKEFNLLSDCPKIPAPMFHYPAPFAPKDKMTKVLPSGNTALLPT